MPWLRLQLNLGNTAVKRKWTVCCCCAGCNAQPAALCCSAAPQACLPPFQAHQSCSSPPGAGPATWPAGCEAAAARPRHRGSGCTHGCAWSAWGRAASCMVNGGSRTAGWSAEGTGAGPSDAAARASEDSAARTAAAGAVAAEAPPAAHLHQALLVSSAAAAATSPPHLATRRYEALWVAVRMRKCVTPSGPATCTKSFSWFRLLSFSAVAVLGAISCAGERAARQRSGEMDASGRRAGTYLRKPVKTGGHVCCKCHSTPWVHQPEIQQHAIRSTQHTRKTCCTWAHLSQVLLQVAQQCAVAAAPEHKRLGLPLFGGVLAVGQVRPFLLLQQGSRGSG